MLAVQLQTLVDGAPEGVTDALDLVAGFDEALTHGFGRLAEPQSAALAALAGALEGSPLGVPVAESAAKVGSGSVSPEGLTALAAGRAALLGAVHDALVERLDGALSRERAAWPQPGEAATAPANVLIGCRSWLHEVAVTGWRGVDHEMVSAVDPIVEALLADPALRRIAVLVDGLAAELRACAPIARMDRLPERRWADLWTRAMLLTWQGDAPEAARPVSGRLLVLGVDVHEHATAVQAQVHAILEESGEEARRLVRVSVSAAKVDTIVGPAVWRLLDAYPVLLGALAGRRSVEVVGMGLLPGGDLLWSEDDATVGEEADPFATARLLLGEAAAPPVAPLERDPVRIAEPVLLEGYETDGPTWTLDGHPISVETGHLPSCGPLTPELVAASTACIGLARWDVTGWSVRPLAVQATVKRKPVAVHGGDWAQGPTDPKVAKAHAKNGDAVAVLRERAGRLLRK